MTSIQQSAEDAIINEMKTYQSESELHFAALREELQTSHKVKKELEKQIKNLNSQMEDYQHEISALRIDLENMHNSADKSHSKFKESSHITKELREKNQNLMNQRDELEDRVENLELEIQEIQERLDEVNSEKADLTDKMEKQGKDKTREANSSITKENNQLREELNQLDQEKQNLLEAVDNAEQKLEEAYSTQRNLEDREDELERELEKVRSANAEFDAEIIILNDQMKLLQQQKQSSKKTAAETAADALANDEEKKVLKKRLNKMEQELKEVEYQKSTLGESLEQALSHIDGLEVQLDEARHNSPNKSGNGTNSEMSEDYKERVFELEDQLRETERVLKKQADEQGKMKDKFSSAVKDAEKGAKEFMDQKKVLNQKIKVLTQSIRGVGRGNNFFYRRLIKI